jgi:hypothetical protein
LGAGLGAITGLFTELLISFGLMKAMTSKMGFNGVTGVTILMISIAESMLILAASLKLLSTIDPERMTSALQAFSVMLFELSSVVIVLNALFKPSIIKKSMISVSSLIPFAAAMLVLVYGMKQLADINPERFQDSLGAVALLMATMTGIAWILGNTKVVDLKDGLAMAGFAAGVYILCLAVKKIAELDPERLVDSVYIVGIMVLALTVAARYSEMGNFKLSNGLAMMGFAATMLILAHIVGEIGALDLKTAATGIGVLAVCVGILVAASKSMDGIKVSSAASLLIVAAALMTFVPLMKGLGSLEGTKIAKALIALAGGLTILGIAATYLAPLNATLLALTGTLALFGLAVLSVGVGVAALGAGLTAIAVSGTAAAGALVLIVEALILGLVDILERTLVNLLDGIKNVIIAIIDVFVECIPALTNGILELITSMIEGLADYTPRILDALMAVLLEILEALEGAIPILVPKVLNIIRVLVESIVDWLKSFDGLSLKNVAITILSIAGVMVAFSHLSSLLVPALKGIGAFSVILAALIGVIAIFGVINDKLPGLEDFVRSGGDLLMEAGTAIGKFFGGIIGGIAAGVTHSLPDIAEDFSAFMENLKPFIDGAKDITPEAMAGVADLAKAILALTAANIIDQIAKFLGAETSLVSFGEELAEFGPYLATFANSVSDIDGDKVSASANAAKMLAEMAKSLPNTGGVISWFTGDNPIEEFGSKLVSFGEDFKVYSDTISGIDSDAVSNSAVMAKSLSELASNLPNNGGVVSWFTGDNQIDKFGKNLVAFGESLVSYSDTISKYDSEAISKSIDDFGLFVALAKDIESTDPAAFTSLSIGINNLGRTAVDEFIACFSGAYDKLKVAVHGLIDVILTELGNGQTSLLDYIHSLAEIMARAFHEKQSWSEVGKEILNFIVIGMRASIKNVKDEVQLLGREVVKAFRDFHEDFITAGKYLVDGFSLGMSLRSSVLKQKAQQLGQDALNTLNNTLQVHSPSRLTEKTGKFFVLGFVNGMLENVDKAFTSAEEVGSSARDGLTKICSQIGELVSSSIDANPTIRPILDLSDVQSKSRQLSHLVGTDQALAVGPGAKGAAAIMLNASRKTDPIQNGPIITIQNMNVDGAENPEEWAHQFVSSLYRQVRMGVV